MSPETVRSSSMIAEEPIIVRFPTIHSRLHLQYHCAEIPKERTGNDNFIARSSTDVSPVLVLDQDGNLRQDTIEVIQTIKTYNNIIAT